MAWTEKRGKTWRVRYERADGTLGSIAGFTTKTAADDKARDIDTDTSRGQLSDPRKRMTLHEWVEIWAQAHHAGANCWAKYRSHLNNHILPVFGGDYLDEITRIEVKRWVTGLRKRLAHSTLRDAVILLSMILGDALEDGLITTSPCRKLRLGTEPPRTYETATPAEVEHIAARCSPADALLIRTAAYTGLRFSELAALRWTNLDLTRGMLTVDASTGALHDVTGSLTLGPPKTPTSARTVHLPDGLVNDLRTHTSQSDHVFTTEHGEFLRRSNFRRRVWLPAAAGNQRRGWSPVLPGLTFHGLRHTHKTWMIEDGVPEVLQHQRLGHRMPGVQGIYSHPTKTMTSHMLTALEHRWASAHSPHSDTPAGTVLIFVCGVVIRQAEAIASAGKDHHDRREHGC